MTRRYITPAIYRSLYGQVLIATVIGVAVGQIWPATGAAMKPLADGFIKLVRMIIAPIVFCTVVTGIAGVGDMKKVGKVGLTALLFFEVVSTVALIIGMIVANVVQPGAGMNADPATLDAKAVAQYATQGTSQGVVDFLLAIIPSSVVDAFARGDILQVLLFAVLFGIALHALHETGKPIFAFVEGLSRVLFGVVAMVMKTAPLAAFGAMAYTIGAFGLRTLAPLATLIASFYLTCLVFIFGVLNAIAWYYGFSLWRLIKVMREEIFIVFGTSSSESVLPRIMAKLTDLGVDRSVVGLVIPAGYSFNLTGTAIYLGLATLFVAQATNTPFPLGDQIRLLAILLITSKGAAGVAGAALIVLAGTISATGQIPVAGVALILGIHRFMGEAVAVTNLIGNGMATILVGKWCGQVDERRLAQGLGVPARVEKDVAAGGID